MRPNMGMDMDFRAGLSENTMKREGLNRQLNKGQGNAGGIGRGGMKTVSVSSENLKNRNTAKKMMMSLSNFDFDSHEPEFNSTKMPHLRRLESS